MKHLIQKILLIVGMLLLAIPQELAAQCAMCRATVENSVSTGGKIGAGLNTGILYLMVMPYLIFVGIAYFWYQQSKKNHAKKIKTASHLRG